MAASAGKLARWVPEGDTPRSRRLLRLGAPSEGNASEELARRFFRSDPLVIYEGESWRLCPDGSLKRWDAAAGRWLSIRPDGWTRDVAIVLEDPAEADAPDPGPDESTASPDVWSIEGCTFVGGTREELCVYGKYTIAFGHEAITMLSRQGGVVEIPCSEVAGVETSGRGRVTGSSLEGARFAFERAEGEVAATTVVKSLVARAGMDTSLRIETTQGDAYFHCDCATPDELRRSLEPFLVGIRSRRKPAPAHAELSGRLVQLADLRSRGLLTEEEFALAVGTVLTNEA